MPKSFKIKIIKERSTYRGMCVHVMFLSMFSWNHISTDSAFFQIAGTMCIMQINIWSRNSSLTKTIIELSVVHGNKFEETYRDKPSCNLSTNVGKPLD